MNKTHFLLTSFIITSLVFTTACNNDENAQNTDGGNQSAEVSLEILPNPDVDVAIDESLSGDYVNFDWGIALDLPEGFSVNEEEDNKIVIINDLGTMMQIARLSEEEWTEATESIGELTESSVNGIESMLFSDEESNQHFLQKNGQFYHIASMADSEEAQFILDSILFEQ